MVYVHALTGAPAPRLVTARDIEFIAFGDVFAAIEHVDRAPVLSEAVLREQHDLVMRIAAEVDAVLPARFGSFCDLDELGRVIERRRSEIRDALDLVRGREQMTIRFIGEPAPEPAPAAPAAPMSGAQYLRARRDAAAGRLPRGLDVIRHAVAPAVVRERLEAADGRMPAALYHLIPRGSAAAYREALERIDAPLGRALTVSGPWPAFAFAPELLP
jgi:hypothetical protein